MRWIVEYITNESANILVEKEGVPKEDLLPVGLGFRPILAERLTAMHNSTINLLEEKLANKDIS